MWESVLNTISRLLSSVSHIGGAVLKFLEDDSLNAFLNTLVVGPDVSTYEILLGGSIGAVLLVGVYNWITSMILPGN